MLRRIKFITLVCLVTTFACQEDEGPPEQPLAHVTQLSGGVNVRPGGHQVTSTPTKDTPLYNEDIVTTGADGKATLTFEGGNGIELDNNTSLVIRRGGGAEAAVGTVLLAGSARATSGGHGIALSIGAPFGVAQLSGTQVSVLSVSVEGGLKVEVGSIEVTDKNGKKHTLGPGQSLAVDGVTILTGTQAIDGLTLQGGGGDLVLKPLVVTLIGPGKAVEILGKGEKNWKLAKKRVALKDGDQVRVKKGGSARLQMGDDSAVNLKPDAVLAFQEAAENATSTSASYAVKQGSTQVLLTKAAGKELSHTVNVGGGKVTIKPTVREANVDVLQGRDGATVVVHEGRAEVAGGPVIVAGMAVDIKGGKVVGSPHPLALTKIELRPKSSVVVYYNKRIPAVSFIVPSSEGKTKIELAADKEFKQVGMAEEVSQSFVYDQLAVGKFYWRLGESNESRAVLQVTQESENDCANCKRTNLIDDTGEKTVVYFQQALPAIVLRWKASPSAANYNLKVFSDGEFDTPLVNEKLTDTKRAFDSGRFQEGKYYWLVTALDQGGAEAGSGRMNSLQISYDNVITALVIRSPKQDIQTREAHVPVTGEVELGAKLFINGKRIELDENNRFSETVEVSKGVNQIVFRAVSSDGLERYYIRDVIRK